VAKIHLYEAKMWSQLYYDLIVPFDTGSRAKIKKAGYSDPEKNFLEMNRDLFRDLRRLAEYHGLGVTCLRAFDSPWSVCPELQRPMGGQPLSRVLDKIFYKP
jgi:hypothetical protein